MRTTVTLDDELLAKAEQLCGDLERSALLKEALRALVQRCLLYTSPSPRD